MYKNIKSRIILISVLIGLILIGTLGFLYINSLAQIPQVIDGQDGSILIQAKKNSCYNNFYLCSFCDSNFSVFIKICNLSKK